MSTVSEFMRSPIVTWVKTFHDDESRDLDYKQLCDGLFLHEIMLQVDPRPPHRGVTHTGNDVSARIRNLDILVRNVKAYYEDVLGQLVVAKLPDIICIGRDPDSGSAIEELKTLLLLVLGCAVQCDRKEEIVENIKLLDVDIQHAIVNCIQQVTDNPETVWLQDWNDLHSMLEEQQESTYHMLVKHVKRIVHERDDFWHNVVELVLEKESNCTQKEGGPKMASNNSHTSSNSDKHHIGVELADCRGKVRRLRQELEEKTEVLNETKEELEHVKQLISKLRQENLALIQDARAAKTYRDELDILTERAAKVDKLEAEIQRYKDKMNELEFYKSRIEEIREDNRILIETKEMLEDQLDSSRKKAELIPNLENELLRCKSMINELTLDRDAERYKLQELVEENSQMQVSVKQSMTESARLLSQLELLKQQNLTAPGDNLCDQLNMDAQARLMKLELENQKLLSVIDNYKESGTRDANEKILGLENENKRLSLKVEQLQDATNREMQRYLELEQSYQETIQSGNKQHDILEMVKSNCARQQKELQREKEQLLELVDTLRHRNKKSHDAKLIDIETENKKLMENSQELRSHISTLEFEKQQQQKTMERLQKSMERLVELEAHKVELEKENEKLNKSVAAFKQTCDKYENLEQENADLHLEKQRLAKMLESTQTTSVTVEKLQRENIFMSIENEKLKKCVDSSKTSSNRIVDLEQEKEELKQNNMLLKKSVEAHKVDRAKHEQLELDLVCMTNENMKLQKALESATKRIEDFENEIHELENENQKLQKTVETLKVSLRKLNDLERESTNLEAENHRLDREKISCEKEAARLKQAIEIKDLSLDEYGSKLSAMERENRRLLKDLNNSNACASRLKDLEKEKRELVQQTIVDKKTLATLREDLVNEKIRTQQLANELEKLASELEKIGLNKEILMASEQEKDENRYKALESMMEEAIKRNLDVKQDKILALESRLQESANRNHQLRDELRLVKHQFESLKQRHEEEIQNSNMAECEFDKKNNTAKEIFELKDHLVEVERMNATLIEESRNLKSQLSIMKEQASVLLSQITCIQYQSNMLSEQHSVLQSQNACLQVENTTLQSQHASLAGQVATLQSTNAALELAKEQLLLHQEELQGAHESLVTDHETLQKLHVQLSSEYESLLSEVDSLKTMQKTLKNENKSLKDQHQALIDGREEVLHLRESLENEKEILKADSKSLSNLRAEHSRLKDDFRLLHTNNERLKIEYKTQQTEYRAIKGENNASKLRQTELQGELAEARDQISSLEVEVSKLSNKCEMLVQVNAALDDDRRSLMGQVSMLLTQYHELLTQTLEDKEHFHEEEKNFADKLNNLRRQKEKLEEKIMEQYRRMENYSPKKQLGCTPRGFGANLVRRVRRAGSELINRVPRSGRSRDRDKEHRRGTDASENADSLDNSSLCSLGNESPDSGSDATVRRVSRESGEPCSETGDNVVDLSSDHRDARRPSAMSNSIFYMKVPRENPGDQKTARDSISSDELVNSRTESLSSDGHQADVDSCSSVSWKAAPSEEMCPARLGLGTPGTRRAVYYNDDHETLNSCDSDKKAKMTPTLRRSVNAGGQSSGPNAPVENQNCTPTKPLRGTTSDYNVSNVTVITTNSARNSLYEPEPKRSSLSNSSCVSMIDLGRSSHAQNGSAADSSAAKQKATTILRQSVKSNGYLNQQLSPASHGLAEDAVNLTQGLTYSPSGLLRARSSRGITQETGVPGNIPESNCAAIQDGSRLNSPVARRSMREGEREINGSKTVNSSVIKVTTAKSNLNDVIINDDVATSTEKPPENSIWYEYGCV